MDDQNNETIDSSNDTQDNGDTILDASLATEEKLAKLEEANKKLYERAKKAEGFIQDADGKWVKKQVQQRQNISEEKVTKPSDILRSEEFRLHREGYNEDEIELIMANGGRKILQDEKHPLNLGLKAAREQRKAEDAASLAANTSGLSEIERKYTEQDLRNMSQAELEKILPHAN